MAVVPTVHFERLKSLSQTADTAMKTSKRKSEQHPSNPVGFKPTDPETAKQVLQFHADQEEKKTAWIEAQGCNSRNLDQKAKLLEKLEVLQRKRFSENPEWLRPGDGTIFSYPSGAMRRVVSEIEGITADHVRSARRAPEGALTLFDLAAEAIAARIQNDLYLLEELAQAGDPGAIKELATTTRRLVKTLNQHASQQPEVFRPTAMNLPNWPVLKGSRPQNDEWNNVPKLVDTGRTIPFTDEMISLLEHRDSKRCLLVAVSLGRRIEDWRTRESGIYFFRRMQPATKAEAKAHELRPFSQESWKDWLESAWAILMEENQDRPERNPDLRVFGQSRERHSEQTGAQKVATEGTRESNIRTRIRERISEAFKEIARSVANDSPEKRGKK